MPHLDDLPVGNPGHGWKRSRARLKKRRFKLWKTGTSTPPRSQTQPPRYQAGRPSCFAIDHVEFIINLQTARVLSIYVPRRCQRAPTRLLNMMPFAAARESGCGNFRT
jgi:hypothetical protein